MIDPSILRAMLAAGATAEMIVVAVEAAIQSDRARWRERKMSQRQYEKLGDKKKGPHTPKEKTTPLDNPTGYHPPRFQPPENLFFEEFWAVYPRKVAKGAARKAYRNALNRATVEEILAGAKRYSASKPEPQFTAHPATWLNADRWLDETKIVNFRNPTPRTWAEIKAEKAAT